MIIYFHTFTIKINQNNGKYTIHRKGKKCFFNVFLVYHLVQYNLSLKFLPSEHVFFSAKKRWATLKLGSRK